MKKLNAVLLALVSVGMTSTALAQQTEKEPGEFYIGARLGVLNLDSERTGYKQGTLYQADNGFNTLDTGVEVGFMLTSIGNHGSTTITCRLVLMALQVICMGSPLVLISCTILTIWYTQVLVLMALK